MALSGRDCAFDCAGADLKKRYAAFATDPRASHTWRIPSAGGDDVEVCWICMEDREHQREVLLRPCRCPRMVRHSLLVPRSSVPKPGNGFFWVPFR